MKRSKLLVLILLVVAVASPNDSKDAECKDGTFPDGLGSCLPCSSCKSQIFLTSRGCQKCTSFQDVTTPPPKTDEVARCKDGEFSDGLGGCVSCHLCTKLRFYPIGCETCRIVTERGATTYTGPGSRSQPRESTTTSVTSRPEIPRVAYPDGEVDDESVNKGADKKISSSIIAGTSVAAVAFVLFVLILLLLIYKSRHRRNPKRDSSGDAVQDDGSQASMLEEKRTDSEETILKSITNKHGDTQHMDGTDECQHDESCAGVGAEHNPHLQHDPVQESGFSSCEDGNSDSKDSLMSGCKL